MTPRSHHFWFSLRGDPRFIPSFTTEHQDKPQLVVSLVRGPKPGFIPCTSQSCAPGMPLLAMAVFYSVQSFKYTAPYVPPGSWANWAMRVALITGPGGGDRKQHSSWGEERFFVSIHKL